MKKIYLLLVLLPFAAAAQPPAGYYNGAFGINGTPLRTALFNIIKNQTSLGYANLWSAYQQTDKKANGKVWDIYSDKPGQAPPYEFTFVTNQCGNYNSEADCYNREHTWPESYFGSNEPMRSDIFQVYPTDGYVNNKRANYPYGKVANPTWTSQNGSRLGPNAYPGAPAGTAFEPIDSFKGDLARTYFYMATRYYTQDANWQNWDIANGAELKPWAVQMLLEWHHNDPVSQKEINRNNAGYTLQQNRNPFIDYPQFADCIWGTGDCTSLSVAGVANIATSLRIYPNPAHNEVHIDWQRLMPGEVLAIDARNMQGQLLYHKDLAAGETQLKLETGSWAKGIYLLQVRTKNTVQVQKLVIE